MELKDENGDHMFLIFDVDLICKRCKTKPRPSECTHMLSFLPPWKSAEKQKAVKQILRNEQTILERESMGTIASHDYITICIIGAVSENGAPLIDGRLVKRFKEKVMWSPPLKQTIPWVRIFILKNSSPQFFFAKKNRP